MGLGSDARGILGDYNLIITHKYTPKGFIWGFPIGLYVGRDTSNYHLKMWLVVVSTVPSMGSKKLGNGRLGWSNWRLGGCFLNFHPAPKTSNLTT